MERLGFSGLYLFDHLVPLGDPQRPILELAAALGAAAARTRARVGTLVMRAPLRGPRLSAAVAATAAALAPGRFVLGLGAGDALSREEAVRYGQEQLGLRERVARVAETIALVRDLAPGVPIWVGGRHPRLIELARLHADGWNGWGMEPDELASVAGSLHASEPGLAVTWGGAVLVGRDRSELRDLVRRRGGAAGVIPGTPRDLVERLRPLAAAGAVELIVSVLPNQPDRWRLFAEEVVPALGGVTR